MKTYVDNANCVRASSVLCGWGCYLHFWWLKHHGRWWYCSPLVPWSIWWVHAGCSGVGGTDDQVLSWQNWHECWTCVGDMVLCEANWVEDLGEMSGHVVGWWTPGHHYVVEGSIKIVYLGLSEETRAGDSESSRVQIKITLNWCANGLKQMELLCDLAFNIRNGVSCRCLSLTQF